MIFAWIAFAVNIGISLMVKSEIENAQNLLTEGEVLQFTWGAASFLPLAAAVSNLNRPRYPIRELTAPAHLNGSRGVVGYHQILASQGSPQCRTAGRADDDEDLKQQTKPCQPAIHHLQGFPEKKECARPREV